MKHQLHHSSDVGGIIRAARKVQGLRQDDAAGSIGVSESFMVKAERGADTMQWGKLFQILEGLGVRITVDIPDASPELLSEQLDKASHRSASFRRRTAERADVESDAENRPVSPDKARNKRGAE
ncbi:MULTISPECIES: helix-turn-helix domain-containing protein [unclassified Cupriavidus]|uniref:helix-turn-helix domain-containing protein n=1 Tax=unclassified Cupriavidus TaxID=2640874 RepID=UPI001C007967|nr:MULTISPECIES: helix-turn-helix domain-containing protein [unclassified Cupriavidus]MCA3187490.1 helix-turn-helix domain-containing protein [Cupriavidus sp.]MCA3189941.1 helix-turn-helix domain-containing protein [Cupriavidus sp.]MCA3196840.1 helix-turn-helix domain-containing protein [Cupriavidus sp.]MCA3204339.1 helix-turn-helix domain-containing protein [Cupriavidus sp.]MCA3208953.1 helix-turn-helix domain-containing protein [Cupriavidus sp.]